MKKRTLKIKKQSLIAIAVAILITLITWGAWQYLSTRTNQAQTQRKLQAKEAELNVKLKELDQSKLNAQQLIEQKKALELNKADLERQLQSRRNSSVVYAEPVRTAVRASIVSNCGDAYLCQIIAKESGGNPYAINRYSQACGLGQALPCSKLLNVCGNLGNVTCQINFFTQYCISRYGSTANAWAFWQNNRWY